MKLSLLSASFLLAGTLLAENLVFNGSFEKFDKEVKTYNYVYFDNWEGLGEVWSNKMGRAAVDGAYKIEIDAKRKTLDSLKQTITTEAGKTYLFRLDAYARVSRATCDFELVVDGEVIAKITPSRYWKKYGATFVGKGGKQTIEIRELPEQNDGYGAIIDNVVIQSDITDINQLRMQDLAKYEILDPWGLDQVAEVIDNDKELARRYSNEQLQDAKDAAMRMNEIIKEAIFKAALVNDNLITGADAKEIQSYILANYKDEFQNLRERFSTIEKRGKIVALGKRALKYIWGRIYNIGLDSYSKYRTTNLDGRASSSYTTLAFLLDSVVDKEKLQNNQYQEIRGNTNTSLDKIVEVILKDRGLNRYNKTSDLRAGAYYANEMNKLILKAIIDTAVANDGKITTADVRTLNNYLVQNYADTWAQLHGDDEDNEEYGYHLVQNDGATTRMFGRNVINTIADGIYHLGYETNKKNRLVNEDGNANQTFEDVAWWLDISLKQDIASKKLNNPDYKEIVGTTATVMDKIILAIFNDEGLLRRVSTDDLRVAARSANRMNELIIEAIKETGVAKDGYFDVEDVKKINAYLVDNYEDEWAQLHGDDEEGEETGFHRIQNDGAVSRLEGKNLINTVADGIYHLGFKTPYKDRLVNEDGNKNATFYSVAYWFNKYLKPELEKGSLVQ